MILLVIAAPWHVLATLRNPPYFDFTMKSEPGQYHGFFWFYFLNEHVFRFLNMRHPRDYNTVPRYLFWLFHLLWFFPWSAFLPGVFQLRYRPDDRAGRMRLLALCWIGFIMVFFTFSTTQEYYSMPIYPALALLLGCAMARSAPISPDQFRCGRLSLRSPQFARLARYSTTSGTCPRQAISRTRWSRRIRAPTRCHSATWAI